MPAKRKSAFFAATQEAQQKPEEEAEVKTSKSQDIKKSKLPEDMKQQTVYLPKKLALRLKAHAAITEQDISSIITELVEQYLDREEGE